MTYSVHDPLELGQRIVAVLETGLRTATYKLGTLMALVDHCVEELPDQPEQPIDVPIEDLAERVIELYWRQVLPLASFGELRQSTQAQARIPRAVVNLRSAAESAGVHSPEMARDRVPDAYRAAVAEVGLTMAQQPLHRLQRVTGKTPGPTFLYDDSWLNDHVSFKVIKDHGGVIRLYPGVAHGLARLSGLLKPTLEILWVEDVVRMNAGLQESGPDLAGHLFGRDRVGLARVREAFYDTFGARCFYCSAGLGAGSPIDHVLPWSRVGIDGLANLVPACQACNGDKSNSMPAVEVITLVIGRDRVVLNAIGQQVSWPVQFDRVVRSARGLYLVSPVGTPTWRARRTSVPLDLHTPPDWLGTDFLLGR